MNFAYVRSAIASRSLWAAFALALALAPPASAQPRVTIALVDGQLGSQGAMSAGLGRVPATQTYLDISQGARVWRRLHEPRELPRLNVNRGEIAGWGAVMRRARSAPADLVPGLLADTLRRAGHTIAVRDPTELGLGSIIAADRRGRFSTDWRHADVVVQAGAPVSASDLRDDGGTVIAFGRPPPAAGEMLLPIELYGRESGPLTSDSTRLDGLVLSTDVAPTILEHLRIEVPEEMEGAAIRSEDRSRALAQPLARLDRLEDIGDRRGTVLGAVVAIWLLVGGLALLARRRLPLRVLTLAAVLLPAALLASAAFVRISEGAEILLVAGTPLLAGALLSRLPASWHAFAVAAAISVGALAVDLAAGSFLTARSLLGPNPALGARFYGIGNELEAILIVLVPAGIAAGLSGRGLAARHSAALLGGGCIAAGLYLGHGRLGADVGAVVALGAAAAVGSLVLLRARLRTAILLLAAVPVAGVGLLALADLLTGGNAHLTRSVLEAGGLEGLADVAERRLRLSAASFGRPFNLAFLAVALPLALLAFRRRDRLAAMLGTPELRAGAAAALAGVLTGTLANDSGALVLLIGSAFLGVVFLHSALVGRNQGAGAE